MDVTRNRMLDSILLLAVLTGLYPGLFLVSNNWFMFGAAQSIYLPSFLVAAAVAAIAVPHFLLSRLPFISRRAARNLLVVFSIYILIGYFDFLIVDLQSRYPGLQLRRLLLLGLAAVVCVFLIAGRMKRGSSFDFVRPLNVALLILTSVASGNLLVSLLTNYQKIFTGIAAVHDDVADIYDRVLFKSAPNIYLLVPDSYPSNPLLKQFFQFDNGEFSEALRRFGFRIYDEYFSSYPYSAEGVHSLLSMSHSYFEASIGNDAIGLREIIAGRGNAVIDILRNNGYKSIFIHETDYLVKGNCFIERCMPELSSYERLRANLQNFYFFDLLPTSEHDYDAIAAMQKQIGDAKEGGRVFLYGHFMGTHSWMKSYDDYYRHQLPEFRKGYGDKIAKMNRLLLDQVSEILRRDPSALIIIAGDHGTWAGAERTEAGFSSNETLDKFNVFLAIRWGGDYEGQYDHALKSSVNLFRHVFAYLSQSERILETRVPDDSYLSLDGVWKVVRNGVVLDEPEYHGPSP